MTYLLLVASLMMWVKEPCGSDRDLLVMMCQDRAYVLACLNNPKIEWKMDCDAQVAGGCRGAIEYQCSHNPETLQ